MAKAFKNMVVGIAVMSLLGISPAFAFFVGKAARRAVMSVKTGTTVADRTQEDEMNSKIDSNLAYLREAHRLDPAARPVKAATPTSGTGSQKWAQSGSSH